MEMQPAPPPPPPPLPPSSWASFSSPSPNNRLLEDSPQLDNGQRSVANPFKDELTTRLSNRNSNKCNLALEQQRLLPLISSSSGQQMSSSSNSKHSTSNLLDKPMSDKQPFAYSPDVNDPNKKGKLDLSQIRSPTMRRRLMANMRSTDEEEENCEEHQSTDEALSQKSNNQNPSSDILQFKTTHDNPRQENHQEANQTVIKCNEPVTFHTYSSYSSPVSQNDVDKLDLELAQSLDSLTKLVSDLQDDCARIHMSNTQQPEARARPTPQVQYYPPQQVITIDSSYQKCNNSRDSYGSMNQGTCSRTHPRDARTIGDYILSPVSSYFMVNSNNMPHSISPYYGVDLELEQTNTTANPHHGRESSLRTFSPQPSTNAYSHTCDTSCLYRRNHQ